jgi:hypothetical protein
MHLTKFFGTVPRVKNSVSQTVLLAAHAILIPNFMAPVFESLLKIVQA